MEIIALPPDCGEFRQPQLFGETAGCNSLLSFSLLSSALHDCLLLALMFGDLFTGVSVGYVCRAS